MTDILRDIAFVVERGKVDARAPHPADLRGTDGVDELVLKALAGGISPEHILNEGLMAGMKRVGEKFRDRLIYVPDVLMSARAMKVGMEHLKPFFAMNQLSRRGTFVLGTVKGDLHDIGKRLVAMVVEGAGYEIIDLGTDADAAKFIDALKEHPAGAVGLSALLTTTMARMAETVEKIKSAFPATKIIVGGAPVTRDFADSIGADAYGAGPQDAVDFLNAEC